MCRTELLESIQVTTRIRMSDGLAYLPPLKTLQNGRVCTQHQELPLYAACGACQFCSVRDGCCSNMRRQRNGDCVQYSAIQQALGDVMSAFNWAATAAVAVRCCAAAAAVCGSLPLKWRYHHLMSTQPFCCGIMSVIQLHERMP